MKEYPKYLYEIKCKSFDSFLSETKYCPESINDDSDCRNGDDDCDWYDIGDTYIHVGENNDGGIYKYVNCENEGVIVKYEDGQYIIVEYVFDICNILQ